jgi:hypothetical protein
MSCKEFFSHHIPATGPAFPDVAFAAVCKALDLGKKDMAREHGGWKVMDRFVLIFLSFCCR